jgi:hypothetical protein
MARGLSGVCAENGFENEFSIWKSGSESTILGFIWVVSVSFSRLFGFGPEFWLGEGYPGPQKLDFWTERTRFSGQIRVLRPKKPPGRKNQAQNSVKIFFEIFIRVPPYGLNFEKLYRPKNRFPKLQLRSFPRH